MRVKAESGAPRLPKRRIAGSNGFMDEKAFVKSATRGLILAHICLGLAGGAALTLFGLLAFTQAYGLVVWVPTVALALVTVGTLWLLQRDAKNRERGH